MNIRNLVSKQIETASNTKPEIDAKKISAKNITVGKLPAKEVTLKKEVAANEEDFVWYIYSSSIGTKLNSEPGNVELSLTEGSSFGIRPTEGDDSTLDLVAEDTGMNVIFRVPAEAAETIIERSSEDEEDSEEDESTDDAEDITSDTE